MSDLDKAATSIVTQARKFCSLAGVGGRDCEQMALEMILNAEDRELFKSYLEDLSKMTGKSTEQLGVLMVKSCDCEIPK